MPGLSDLIRNPRRLQQFAETPGNYSAALDAASRMDERAYATRQERQRQALLKDRAKQAKAEGKIIEGMTLETGDVMDRIQLPNGEVAPINTPSGKVVKVPGKSNLFVDPSTGEPYQADPTKPTGLRSAYDAARRVARGGKEYAVIPGIGEKEIGPDQKALAKQAEEEQKAKYDLQAEGYYKQNRPFRFRPGSHEPIPRHSDEEWQALQKKKAEEALGEAHVKKLKAQADRLELDAKVIGLNAPKVSKEDEEAYDSAISSLESFAAGKDLDTAAEELANAPDTQDENQAAAKATAQSYLSLRDKVKPAKDAEAKAKELELRSIDLKKQMLDPDAWKAGKAASLAEMPDADLHAEAKAQADIITEQETEAQGTLELVAKGRASLEEKHAAFLAERQAAEAQGLSLEQKKALDDEQAQLEAELKDYDDWNAEAVTSAQGSLKASQDRREVLAAAGAEIDRRNKASTEQFQAQAAKAAVLDKAKPLYDWAKDNFHYTDDYRGMNDYGILDAEAKKAGLDPAQAREALQTFRQLDWSNPHIDTTTGKPLDEKARVLPDGNVTVNPGLLLDPQAYDAAVDEAETTPEAKARAKAMRAELAGPVAAEALANLRKNSSFAEWLDENTKGNDVERMEQFNASMKEGGALNAAVMKFLGSTAGLPSGWLGAIAGLTGSDKALDYARYWQDRAQAYQTAAGEAGKGTNMAGRFLASVAGGVPSVMESLAAGGVAGRVLGATGKAALYASAADAMAQSGGGTFVDAVDAYMQQGLSQEEAKAKAAAPAIASGLVTGVLTTLGSGGVESLLRPEGQALGRAAIKKGIMAQVGEGVSDEAAEEWADQMMQGIIAQLSYDPNKPLEQVFAEATEAGLVGGVLGGGASGLRGFLDRNAPEAPAQPQAPAPTPGPVAPAQISQPAQTGDIAGAIKAFTPTGEAMLPQAVADTVKRTNRTTEDVSRAAASGLVKVAQGASLESLDAREREALGFVSKDGKIVPAPKTTPLVESYKGKLVIRNEAAEWLDDEGQPLLARQIRLDEAERKTQIDEAEAKADQQAEAAAKKKAGQAKPKAAESKSRVSEEVITSGSLPEVTGANPVPATISGATEAPKPSQTITGSNAEMAAEMPVQPATAGEAISPPPANEPQPQAAVSPEPSVRQVVPESRELPVVPEQPPASAQETALEPEPAAGGGLTAKTKNDVAPVRLTDGTLIYAKTSQLADASLALIQAFNEKGEPIKGGRQYFKRSNIAKTPVVVNETPSGEKQAALPVTDEAQTGLTPAQAARATPAQKAKAARKKATAPPASQVTARQAEELAELRKRAANILVKERGFHPQDAEQYAAKLGDKKDLEGFIADNSPEALAALEAQPSPVDAAAAQAATSPANATPEPSEAASPEEQEEAEMQAFAEGQEEAKAKPPEQMTPEEVVEEPSQEAIKNKRKPIIRYKYKTPSGTGPFYGSMDAPEGVSVGDTIRAPFGEAQVTSKSKVGKLSAKEIQDIYEAQFEEAAQKRSNHRKAVNQAISQARPVSAAAVDAYGIKLPEGYTREGDLYVYRQPAEAGQAVSQAGQAVSEPAAKLTKSEQRKIDSIASTLGEVGVKNPNVLTELKIRLGIRRGYERQSIETAKHYENPKNAVYDLEVAKGQREAAKEHKAEADRLQALIAKIEASQAPAKAEPTPATPLAKAKAAIAAYTLKAQGEREAAKGTPAEKAAVRKMAAANLLLKRLTAFDGVVDYKIETEYEGKPTGGMQIAMDGSFIINPDKILNQVAAPLLNQEGIRKAIDKFIVHEFIHMAALSQISDSKIKRLYNSLTREAKEASRKLYLAESPSETLNDFQAAHEWFAQLVEARMSGEISNQGLIEASTDPDFRDKLAAMFREFVAKLREIAGIVKDPAMAEQIRAEADAVEVAVRQMAEKAGLAEKPKAETVEESAKAEPSKTKGQLAQELAGEEPKDYTLRQQWKKRVSEYMARPKTELEELLTDRKASEAKYQARTAKVKEWADYLQANLGTSDAKWRSVLASFAEQNGVTSWAAMMDNGKGEEIYRLAQWLTDTNAAIPASSPAPPAAPAEAKPEPGQPPVTEPAPSPAPAAEPGQGQAEAGPEVGKITDFGEKIFGARKDVWGKFKRIMDQAFPESYEDVTLSRNVPEPDYEAAIEAGVSVDDLALLKAIRDNLPPKPKKSWKLKSWGDAVKFLHQLTQDVIKGKGIDPAVLTGLERTQRLSGLANAIKLYKHLGYPLFTKAKGWTVANWDVGYYKGQKLDKFMPATIATKDERSTDMLVLRTGEEAWQEVAEMIKTTLAGQPSEAPKAKEAKKLPFAVWQDRRTGQYFVGIRGINGVVRLKTGFPDVKAARQHLADNRADLEAMWQGMKEHPEYRRTVNEPRQGPARRDGDVSSQMFQDAFGFRGVQFGNWVESDRRQTDLNQAYDALMDLAEALGVPPKAMSLDGSLGLAFGARGVSKYKAHYEPGEVVINLTKKTGPGSLAHEWFHAFDNYFARLDDTGATKARPLDKYATTQKPAAAPKNMRPEVWQAFRQIASTLKTGPFAERSATLDDARSKPYYSTLVEKSARAFEKYIADRLLGKDITNDYLVNIVKDESPALPTSAEMADGIQAAYDNLFNILDSVPTETGVMLRTPPGPATPQPLPADEGGQPGLGSPPANEWDAPLYSKLPEGPVSLELYHGTWRGGYEEFRPDTHFSRSRKYAERYMNPSASSLGMSGSKTATDQRVYKTKVDFKKVFDTRHAKARQLFNKEFFQRYGTGTPIGERGLPDWTDGIDLAEWLQENHPEYDGIVLDEGAEPVDGKIRVRPESYIPLASAKITIQDSFPAKPAKPGLASPPAGQAAVTPAQDAEYLAAVEAGDMDKAQRMVDEAARAAGYKTGPVWQGVQGKRGNVYKLGNPNRAIKSPKNNRFGFFFSFNKEVALDYTGRGAGKKGILRKVFLSGNLLDLTSAKLDLASIKEKLESKNIYFDFSETEQEWVSKFETAPMSSAAFDGDSGEKLKLKIQEKGYDGVLFTDSHAHSYTLENGIYIPRFSPEKTAVVFNPNQIKSADAVTRDESGNVIPLSQRFNPASPSILYNPPGRPGQEAASDEAQAAELEEAANEAVREAGEILRELQQQGEQEARAKAKDEAARLALANDPQAVRAIGEGEKIDARNPSLIFKNPAARRFYQAILVARAELGMRTYISDKELQDFARKQFDSDPEGVYEWALDKADEGESLNDEEQAVLFELFDRAQADDSPFINRPGFDQEMVKLGHYIRESRGTTGRMLRYGRDRVETPQQRWKRAFYHIKGPDSKQAAMLRIAPSAREKARRIAELEDQLSKASAARRADIEAALAKAKRQKSRAEVLEEITAENERLMDTIIDKMGGVTRDDIMHSPLERYGLQTAILDLPAVREALDKFDNGRDIMQLAFRGFSNEHIAGALQIPVGDVADFIKQAQAAIIRPAVTEQVKAGKTFGDWIKSGLDILARKTGLRQPPSIRPLENWRTLITGKRQTLDEVTAEVNRVMGYALQSQKARDSKKLMSKVINTPTGQRVRIFVPFDPDDATNYYSFAREYSAAKANVFDKFYEYWINWPLLSGPQTQVVNFTGNAAQVAWHYTGQRLAEATLNTLIYHDPNSAQLREFWSIIKGFWKSIGPALDMARQSFLTEGDTVRHKYLNEPLQIDVVDGDIDKVGGIRAAVGGKLGRLNRLPGRVLRWTDSFFKTAILYAEASSVAYRKAHASAKAQGLKGQARRDFIDTEIDNTLKDPQSPVWADVMDTAEELLFQDDNVATAIVDTMLGGYRGVNAFEKALAEAKASGNSKTVAVLNAMIAGAKAVNRIMRFIFPFQRTPTNIIRVGLRKGGGSAIVGLYHLLHGGWLKYKDGTPMLESYTKAMQIKDLSETGIAVFGWLMLASMFEGDDDDEKKPFLIVGSRPSSRQGYPEKQAFLNKYGGESSFVWQDGKGNVIDSKSFGRYEPIGTLLTTWVDAYRNFQEVRRRQKAGEAASFKTYMLSSFVSGLENKSFLQGLSNIMEWVRDIEERRENPDVEADTKFVLRNIVPNIIKQPMRNWDEFVRETKTAGAGYSALPNPALSPKLPTFAAEPKISTTGQKMRKDLSAPARLLFPANTVVTPQPDALLYRANRLNPTAAKWPSGIQRDEFFYRAPGAKPKTPGYHVPIENPAEMRRFAEMVGQEYTKEVRKYVASLPPALKAKPGPEQIEGLAKAMTEARKKARILYGLQKPQTPAITTSNK